MDEKKIAVVPSLTSDEVNEILLPDLSADSFKIADREFSLRVLPWRWELEFRRHALPILTEEMKPFERALQVFKTNAGLLVSELGIAAATGKSELDGDSYVTKAVIIICLSQDADIRKAAAKGEEVPNTKIQSLEKKYRVMIENLELPNGDNRNFLREIVRKQMDKLNMLQKLGESLMARLADMARLSGMSQEEFVSLRRDFMQQLRSFMAKDGNTDATSASSFSQSTANGSESASSRKKSEQSRGEDTEADREAENQESADSPELSTVRMSES